MRFEVIQISAGSGPVEVREFVALLADLLERTCVECGLDVHEIVFVGSESTPASVEIWVSGGAAARLKSEIGVHQLIARSPHRGRASRKRWFASVSIHEKVEFLGELKTPFIRNDDLIVTAARAGGKGGQHVNKVSSAVRVQHVPSGITVRSAGERSQRLNLRKAIERIGEQLLQRQASESAKHERQMRRSHLDWVRGNPVRTYRLSNKRELCSETGTTLNRIKASQ